MNPKEKRKYFISIGYDNRYTVADGYPITLKGYEEYSFFIVDDGSGWIIYEKTTGASVTPKFCPIGTIEEVVNKAISRLDNFSKEYINETISNCEFKMPYNVDGECYEN